MAQYIQFEVDEQGIGRLTVNRPAVRNALNWEAMEEFSQAIAQAEAVPDLRVLIITGAGRDAFISGGDLRELYETSSAEDGLRQHDLMADAMERMSALPVPVIAALEGATRGGGCEVALAADMRVAAEDATLGFAQVKMGVTPGWGGARRLYTAVGYKRAMELLLTGRTITALDAEMMGLVDRTAAPGEALKEAYRLASEIAQSAPLAIRGIKAVIRAYHTGSLEAGRLLERETFGRLWGSADHIEATAAYLERRPPQFRGE
jgi:enoyl-CoA hydratase